MRGFSFVTSLAGRFQRDERGLALTEYLILLGLLTAAVVAAVIVFGQSLGATWSEWAVWMGNAIGTPPTPDA
jgi:pilus assembly protein Flp/PilA